MFKTLLKKDYLLVILCSVIYFLTVKGVIPAFTYLALAILISIYFFPVKLFIGNDFLSASNKKKAAKALSYFVVSNIIILNAVIIYVDGKEFLHITLSIYSIINLAFLFYFHFKENMHYNFILSVCATIFSSAAVGLQY